MKEGNRSEMSRNENGRKKVRKEMMKKRKNGDEGKT